MLTFLISRDCESIETVKLDACSAEAIKEERREGERAGQGHYRLCVCAQWHCRTESASCQIVKEFHQNQNPGINLTTGMFQSTAGREHSALARAQGLM